MYQLSDTRRFDLRFPLRTLAFLRREGIRLVAAHGFSTGVLGRLAGSVAGTCVCVLLEHADVFDDPNLPDSWSAKNQVFGITLGLPY